MDLKQTALDYAQMGFAVIPCHNANPATGLCDCGRAACDSPGKHPRTSRGVKDATTDEETISRWWGHWPGSNIAIAGNGVFALDFDPRDGGLKTLEELKQQHGDFPQDATVFTGKDKTGNRGLHIYFKQPADEVGCPKRHGLGDGVDVKGVGGYLMAPPSLHKSGVRYEAAGGELQPAEAPTWLVEQLNTPPDDVQPKQPQRQTKPVTVSIRDVLLKQAQNYISEVGEAGEGNRNDAAFSLAGHLAAFVMEDGGTRLDEQDILALMSNWNLNNNPPLKLNELQQAVSSALSNGSPRKDKPVQPDVDIIINHKATEQRTVHPPLPWQPFPLEVFPEDLQNYINYSAASKCIDPAEIGLLMWPCLAAAVGLRVKLWVFDDWYERAIFRSVLVKRSGTVKTPALKSAAFFLLDYQTNKDVEFQDAAAQYEIDIETWKLDKDRDPEAKPQAPVPHDILVNDPTVAGMMDVLKFNDSGVLLYRDELAGWFSSFGAYAGGRKGGGDSQFWLETFNGDRTAQIRADGKRRVAQRAGVSVCGTIQPQVFQRVIAGDELEVASGQLARLLLAMPPSSKKRYTKTAKNPYQQKVEELFRSLMEFRSMEEAEVTISDAAHAYIQPLIEQHNQETHDLCGGSLAACWAKLEAYLHRFMLVIQCLRWAESNGSVRWKEVDVRTAELAWLMMQWCKHESQRVYEQLVPGEQTNTFPDPRMTVLHEYISNKEGTASVREICRGPRQFRGKQDEVIALLEEMERLGIGTVTRDRKSVEFTLAPGGDSGAGANTPLDGPESRQLAPSPVTPPPKMESDDDWEVF